MTNKVYSCAMDNNFSVFHRCFRTTNNRSYVYIRHFSQKRRAITTCTTTVVQFLNGMTGAAKNATALMYIVYNTRSRHAAVSLERETSTRKSVTICKTTDLVSFTAVQQNDEPQGEPVLRSLTAITTLRNHRFFHTTTPPPPQSERFR